MAIRNIASVLATGRGNNFDFMRFAAASSVIISHSFVTTGNLEPTLGVTTLGRLGVSIFFIISGFLITQSWIHHPNLGPFIAKRLLRIVPALACVTLFVLLVLGPIFSTVSHAQYFQDRRILAYLGNVSIFFLSYNLPGLWVHNPYPATTNAPLWTLPMEFIAYLAVAGAGITGLIKRKFSYIPAVLVVIALTHIFSTILFTLGIEFQNHGSFYLLGNLAFFATGSFLYLRREDIIYSDKLALVALAVIIFSVLVPWQFYLELIALPYLVIYLALIPTRHLQQFAKYGDFSYGMYIYAWPLQQAAYGVTGGSLSPLMSLVYAYPLAVALAAISWHGIEKHALKLKKFLDRNPALRPV